MDETNECIRIRGASTHNLKNVDLDIPRNQLVVLTGVSGSGKTSLAFDTLYSEGRRQFIEGQSVYTRQFLNQLPRAEVESIEGLQPTLAIDQRSGYDNPRSTVATLTEIYDYLRVLMARCGEVHCYQCGKAIQQQTVDQIRDRMMEFPERTKIMVLAPLVRGRKGQHQAAFQKIRTERLVRVRVDGGIVDIEQAPELEPQIEHTIEAVTDRIIIREGIENRLVESLELAVRLGNGLITISFLTPETSEWQDKTYSTKYSCPTCEIDYAEVEPRTFSFNSPYGACQHCTGLGTIEGFEPNRILTPEKSLQDGAISLWASLPVAEKQIKLKQLEPLLHSLEFDFSLPLSNLPAGKLKKLWNSVENGLPGIDLLLQKDLATATDDSRRTELENLQATIACPQCEGSRLCDAANAVLLAGKSIASITALTVESATSFFQTVGFSDARETVAEPLVTEISHRLDYLQKVGVGYLSLSRAGQTLSGGEHQRVRLATAIGTGLTCVCFVLDEPSIGLHQRDNQRLIEAITFLRDRGNSVIVVEHDEEIMRAADVLIDVGPAAGKFGGQIVASGTPDEVIRNSDGLTANYLAGTLKILRIGPLREPGGNWLKLFGASGNNLKQVDLEIPLGLLCCVTGVSGSGKSTLINDTLAMALREQLDLKTDAPAFYQSLQGADEITRLIQVDQRPLGSSSRSCAATYTGIFEELRKIFAKTKEAKQLGYSASRFSFNSKSGHCADCQGHGQQKIKMNFLPDIFVQCPACKGKRFNLQTLQIRFRGLTIANVLELSVEQAIREFENIEKVRVVLQCLLDVGLGYLTLGQPSSTLSGGERQRIKLATELSKPTFGHTIYLMDEPTTGLHFEDIKRMLDVISKLVDEGNTVIVIEHNLDVIKCADWIIDMGPEGGSAGGTIVAQGPPSVIANAAESHTGQYLKQLMSI